MELQELKQKRKEFLEDTWKYYSEDVSRRSVELRSCKYRTSSGKKCAIGRHLSDDNYNDSMEGYGVGHPIVLGKLPNELIDLGIDFLFKVQILHDHNEYWNEHGLSGQGELLVGQIEEEFCR